jgi:hypothetical protein
VQKHFFWLFLKVCFGGGLVFGVCLVEVVVVEGFFQHGCSTKTIGCGSFYVACGMLEDFLMLVVPLSFLIFLFDILNRQTAWLFLDNYRKL